MSIVDFCGEQFPLSDTQPFRIGREGDLAVDDNPYLHRNFLVVTRQGELWWLNNVGNRIPATVSDAEGRMQAWLAPGVGLPLVFERTLVLFTAGPTTYELEIHLDSSPFAVISTPVPSAGGVTIGSVDFTPDQLLLVIALAEPALRRQGWGGSALPSSAAAADRLGWPLTRFNRKLDNVCEKLTRLGVKGLHGGPERLAVDRRARLVECAVAARWVTVEHLPLLDRTSPEAPRGR